MSDQNLAFVRHAYDAFQRGDMPAVLSLLADDIEWETPTVAGIPFGGHRRGKAAVAEFFTQLVEAEDVESFEAREFIAQGERIPVLGRYRGRVKATGRVAQTPWVQLFTVSNGKITQFFELYDIAVAEHAYRRTATA